MKNFINLYTKSFSETNITDKEYKLAAEDLYRLFITSELARGKEIPVEPKFICFLSGIMSVPKIEGEKFSKQLSLRFKEVAGEEWDSEKYLLVPIPTQVIGSQGFAVFEI